MLTQKLSIWFCCCCSGGGCCGFWNVLLCSVETLVIFFCRIFTSCTISAGKKPERFVPRTYPSNNPQSVEPSTSMTSPVWIDKWPMVELEYGSMQTTVVLGWPIEQTALSELVPTPDESLIISLVSPILLSKHVENDSIGERKDKKHFKIDQYW